MTFIWQKTKLGTITLDGDSFKTLLSRRLPKEAFLQEVSFSGDTGRLNVFMVVSDDVSEVVKNNIEKKLSGMFTNSGIELSSHWVVVAAEKKETKKNILHMPVFWAAVCAGACALVHIGLRGLLWSVLFGVIGYCIGWTAMTDKGRELVSDITGNIAKKIKKK